MKPIYLLASANFLLYVVGVLLGSGLFFGIAIAMSLLLMGGTFYVWRVTAPFNKASQELRATKEADKVFDEARLHAQIQSKPHHTERRSNLPPPRVDQNYYVDALRREHNKLSGEEVFHKLKRHNRRLRH